MAKTKKAASKSKKKPLEQYAHKGKQRENNPLNASREIVSAP